VTIPQLDLDGARRAQARLVADLDDLTDDQARRPSRLPGWSVGHVLTHLARNADSHTAMFAAAARGEIADQYPGGQEQRTADIEAGADRTAGELVDDLRVAGERLHHAWASTDERAWALGQGRTMSGVQPITELVFRRWREIEVHHADLGLAFGWRNWSDAYVDLELDRAASALAPRLPGEIAIRLEPTDAIGVWIVETVPCERVVVRAPRHELLAWLIGRHERDDWPDLAPW
jgi:maleylpyruvate isomerase